MSAQLTSSEASPWLVDSCLLPVPLPGLPSVPTSQSPPLSWPFWVLVTVQGPLQLRHLGSVVQQASLDVTCRLSCPAACSPIRDRTHIPCIGRRVLNHQRSPLISSSYKDNSQIDQGTPHDLILTLPFKRPYHQTQLHPEPPGVRILIHEFRWNTIYHTEVTLTVKLEKTLEKLTQKGEVTGKPRMCIFRRKGWLTAPKCLQGQYEGKD